MTIIKYKHWSSCMEKPAAIGRERELRRCPECGVMHRGTQSRCKPCYATWGRGWRARNREKAREACRRYQGKYPERTKRNNRAQALRKNYGITIEVFEALLAKQNGRCAICGTDKPCGPGKKLMVDHDHKTGRIRGLLCNHCNSTIGYALECPDRLKKAIAYLEGGPNLR